MADLLEHGSTWLQGKRHNHMTQTVTYVRPPASVSLSATIGKTVFETTDEFGVVQKTESRDFLIRTDDLLVQRKRFLPNRGDRILEEQSGDTYVYEVMAPSGEPHYRYSDVYRQTLRIHTKHVDTRTLSRL